MYTTIDYNLITLYTQVIEVCMINPTKLLDSCLNKSNIEFKKITKLIISILDLKVIERNESFIKFHSDVLGEVFLISNPIGNTLEFSNKEIANKIFFSNDIILAYLTNPSESHSRISFNDMSFTSSSNGKIALDASILEYKIKEFFAKTGLFESPTYQKDSVYEKEIEKILSKIQIIDKKAVIETLKTYNKNFNMVLTSYEFNDNHSVTLNFISKINLRDYNISIKINFLSFDETEYKTYSTGMTTTIVSGDKQIYSWESLFVQGKLIISCPFEYGEFHSFNREFNFYNNSDCELARSHDVDVRDVAEPTKTITTDDYITLINLLSNHELNVFNDINEKTLSLLQNILINLNLELLSRKDRKLTFKNTISGNEIIVFCDIHDEYVNLRFDEYVVNGTIITDIFVNENEILLGCNTKSGEKYFVKLTNASTIDFFPEQISRFLKPNEFLSSDTIKPNVSISSGQQEFFADDFSTENQQQMDRNYFINTFIPYVLQRNGLVDIVNILKIIEAKIVEYDLKFSDIIKESENLLSLSFINSNKIDDINMQMDISQKQPENIITITITVQDIKNSITTISTYEIKNNHITIINPEDESSKRAIKKIKK